MVWRNRGFGEGLTGPLIGLKVLDLTRLLPGGYATLLLADLGADVVKVEEPGKGDYIRWTPPIVGEHSAAHIALNRNKRSVTLDLKSPRGKDVFLDLAGRFDVVIESFRPGVMDRLGVGWDVLHERHPALIYCAISGYGRTGPRVAAAGHDINYIGYAGVLSIVGAEGGPPVVPGVQVGDLGGGGMAAVIAILAALHKRSETGLGDLCDISMMDGAMSWLSIHAGEYVATREVPQPGLMHLSGRYPCYRTYPAADGALAVGALEPQFWSELCRCIDRPDLEGDGFAQGERRAEVIADLSILFGQRTRAEWMEHFGDADVCVAPVNDFSEAFEDPQIRAREMVFESEVPGVGPWTHVGNPLKMTGAPGRVDRLPPPGLGEHTEQVLREEGFTDPEISSLREDGVV